MKKKKQSAYEEYLQGCADTERARLQAFFDDVSLHCQLPKLWKKQMHADFEEAILYYLNSGLSLDEALSRLDAKYLGGFYAHPPVMWFPLDEAAKIYPLSMTHGRMAVFRLSVYLKKPIVPELLQMALHFTVKRFPSFATTLKKGIFWHYLDTAKRCYQVETEQGIPCRPLNISQSGSQSLRVLYYENRISVEFFHVITDGTGGMTFLKVLCAEYLRLTGVSFTPDETLWDINMTPTTAEFENAFLGVPKSAKSGGFADKRAVQMSGKLTAYKPCRLLHFKMSASALKAAASKYGATVTAYLLSLIFLSAKAATEECEGELSIQVPVNMRKYYPSETVRNFALYCGIRLPLSSINSVEQIIGEVSAQLTEKASKDAMSQMLTATRNIVSSVRGVPLSIKYPVANKIYGYLGDTIFSTVFSNLGVVKLPPELADHIDYMDFALGTNVSHRVSNALITFGDTATFSISKMTLDPSFEEKLLDLLQKDSISAEIEGSVQYGH